MQIQDIKVQLSIQEVLSLYNLTPDKNQRLNCPWHNDKTPSLQIYPKTNTYTCFSTNCAAGSGDVIDFIMRYENITKHEALKKATEMINPSESLTKIAVLTKYMNLCQASLKRSQKGKAYLKSRNLKAKEFIHIHKTV